ncbi:urease accessory protein UreD [Gordonia sp. NPDC058843]|uniref:urease accessory protein UreD n=1 Tax=Gordonia sp. NPDC058843 TaxID=3346648 RepID=UPI0036CDC406
MRTEVDIVATVDRGVRHRAVGGLGVRVTSPGHVQLIGTAATPLGGDEIVVRIEVEPGAHLHVGSVAATIALPARERVDSSARWEITVGTGGRLRVDPQPTVVAGGAFHRSDMSVTLASGATLDLHEHIQIGRAATMTDAVLVDRDRAGSWIGGLRVDVDGQVVLVHRLSLGHGTPAGAAGHRAASSVFRYPDDRLGRVHATEFAARLQLAGGASLTTALGTSVTAARGLADDLEIESLAVAT